MSFIGNLLNGSQGAGFQGTSANIATPTTPEQIAAAQAQTQSGIGQQQNFVDALNAQNGIGNQSAVYNQLAGVANGTGPNPAQAQLAQSTGANVANQAALMAGQRGAAGNPALMARQAAMQGAGIQQNAAGQAATLQANQSLNALNSMGGIAGQQVSNQAGALNSLNSAAQGNQGQLLGAVQGQNNANVANQSNLNTTNASIAKGNQQAQSDFFGGIMNTAGTIGGAASGMAHGGVVGMANGGVAGGDMYTALNSPAMPNPNLMAGLTLPAIAPALQAGMQAPTLGGSISSALANMPETGNPQSAITQGVDSIGNAIGSGITSAKSPKDSATSGIMSNLASTGSGNGKGMDANLKQQNGWGDGFAKGGKIPSNPKGPQSIFGQHLANMANGGKVPAMLSPGEVYIPPNKLKEVAKGKDPIKEGIRVPGQAKVKGDSTVNDTVPADVEKGGIVLPKSVMESKNPQWAAHAFVMAHLANQGLKK